MHESSQTLPILAVLICLYTSTKHWINQSTLVGVTWPNCDINALSAEIEDPQRAMLITYFSMIILKISYYSFLNISLLLSFTVCILFVNIKILC